jgi:putative endonuclease
VKTRRSARFGPPEESVTSAKQRRIRRLTARWLTEHPVPHRQVRFDVAAVEGTQVRLLEGAF